MGKLKRLLWINSSGAGVGGAESYIRMVAKEFSERGIEQFFLYDPDENYEATYLKSFNGSYPAIDIEKQVAALKPDLVFIHQIKRTEVLKALEKISAPVAIFIHDTQIFVQKESQYTTFGRKSCYPPSQYKWYFPIMEKLGSLRIKLRYSIAKCGFENKLLKILKSHKNFVVGSKYMGVHLESFGISGKITVNPLFCTVEKKYERKPQRGNILFCGQLVRGKGLDILLRALVGLPEFNLTVCGRGKQEDELQQLSRELKLDDRVQFKGKVSSDELQKYMAESEVCVVTSRIPESFCLMGIEAMTQEVPVISTALGGMTEWQRDNAVLTIEPNNVQQLQDSLKKLYNDPDLRLKMGHAGKKLVEKEFTADKHIGALMSLFEELIRD